MAEKPDNLKRRYESAPSGPGVYIFKDPRGGPLYVGKAKNLKARIGSHLANSAAKTVRGAALLKRTANIEFIRTDTEKEALLVEDRLIKSLKPRYNVLLRDDKAFLLIRMDPREEYPAFTLVRRPRKESALYFGPYVSAASARETLRLVESAYPLRRCGNKRFRGRTRPCLNHQMGLCLGPCALKVDREEYMKLVDEVVLFLKGRTKKLLAMLKEQMKQAAEELRFEDAAVLRDRLRSVRSGLEAQKVVLPRPVDLDVLGAAAAGPAAVVELMTIREGALTGSAPFRLRARDAGDEEVLSAFIKQFYGLRSAGVPERIVTSKELPDRAELGELLSEIRGSRVEVVCPKRGRLKELARLADTNASSRLVEEARTERGREELTREIERLLGLESPPRRIDSIDISHLGGDYAVGALAAFLDTKPKKSGYRHFRIRGAATRDDYAMLSEVLGRRLAGSEEPPDLIIIDGGRGQLSTALKVVDELGLSGKVAVAALAKGPDRLFVPGKKSPLDLEENREVLFFLMRMRDEAHRFANRYRNILAVKGFLGSELEEIPGIGPKRRKELVKAFGSIEGIKKSSLEELAGVPAMNKKAAAAVFEHFKR